MDYSATGTFKVAPMVSMISFPWLSAPFTVLSHDSRTGKAPVRRIRPPVRTARSTGPGFVGTALQGRGYFSSILDQ